MFPFGMWAPIVLPMILGGHHRKIVPYDLDGPFKQVIMSLFRLAWSSKIRLPLLITVAFLALDVNLQVEINVFWAPGDREGDGVGDADREGRPRRQNLNANATRRPPTAITLPTLAPLAQFDDFNDLDDDGSDSDSSTISLPSVYEAPLPRYLLHQSPGIPPFLNNIQDRESHQEQNRVTDIELSRRPLE